MSRTTFDPKTSSIIPAGATTEVAPSGGSGAPAIEDSFTETGGDAYKALVTGGAPKAEAITSEYVGALIDEAAGAAQLEANPTDPIQDMLGGMMMGDNEEKPSLEGFALPHVPDLEKDIYNKVPGSSGNNYPIVERYRALKKYITALHRKAKKWLSPEYADKMSSTELRKVNKLLKQLERLHAKCATNLKKAELNYKWELQNREASYRAARDAEEA